MGCISCTCFFHACAHGHTYNQDVQQDMSSQSTVKAVAPDSFSLISAMKDLKTSGRALVPRNQTQSLGLDLDLQEPIAVDIE